MYVQIMKNNDINNLIKKTIGETLELLELAGLKSKEIEVIRKAMWKIHNETILLKNVCSNDKFNR